MLEFWSAWGGWVNMGVSALLLVSGLLNWRTVRRNAEWSARLRKQSELLGAIAEGMAREKMRQLYPLLNEDTHEETQDTRH